VYAPASVVGAPLRWHERRGALASLALPIAMMLCMMRTVVVSGGLAFCVTRRLGRPRAHHRRSFRTHRPMPSIKASFDAFTTYHAAVAPVLGTDPAAVDAGLVEAALDAVLAKRPSPTSPEEHKAAYRHLRDLGEKSPLAFKLHYELHLKHQCNLAPIAIATESANADDWKDDRICIKEKTMVGSVM
jgi:hypothetical protein